MKLAALLLGVLASAFAWAAGVYLADISAEFLRLFPPSSSMQLLGLASWHGLVAAALAGGLLAVVSPWSGAVLLLAAAGGWAALGATLPVGFSPQVVVPLVLSAGGGLAALGAGVRGAVRQRRAANRMSLEDLAREEALRLDPIEPVDPHEDLLRALSARAGGGMNERGQAMGGDDAIRLAPAASPPDVPRGVSALMVLNVAALVVLTAAVALLLYVSVRTGHFATAFGIGPDAVTRPAALEAGTAPADGGNTASVPDATATDSIVAPASAPAGLPAAAPAVAAAAATPTEWTDPFAYCAAVGTVDYPDRRYAGPRLPVAIAQALNAPLSSPPDRVHWRCADGSVLGCLSFTGPTCAPTPTIAEMMEYCLRHPDAQGLLAPNGTWACDGTEPVVPPGASWPVDARGFLPGAWVAILPPAATPG